MNEQGMNGEDAELLDELESTLRRVLREELQLIQNQRKLMPDRPITEAHGFLAGIDTTVERETDRF